MQLLGPPWVRDAYLGRQKLERHLNLLVVSPSRVEIAGYPVSVCHDRARKKSTRRNYGGEAILLLLTLFNYRKLIVRSSRSSHLDTLPGVFIYIYTTGPRWTIYISGGEREEIVKGEENILIISSHWSKVFKELTGGGDVFSFFTFIKTRIFFPFFSFWLLLDSFCRYLKS